MNSGFIKHLFFWVLFVPLLSALTFPIFFDRESYEIDYSEFELNEDLLGTKKHNEAIESSKLTYQKIIQPNANWLCETSFNTGLKDTVLDKAKYATNKSRCQALLRGIYRLNVEFSFLFGILIMAVAAFYDGVMQRMIGKYEFGYNNPVVFNFVTHGLIASIGLVFVGIFLPITFNMYFYIFYAVFIASVAWLSAKNFQTGA